MSTAAPDGGARLVSLDAFRGFTMFWIVGGATLVSTFQHLGQNPIIDEIVRQLHHSEWDGLRFYDVIWPSFMLMTGMSLPFSYAKRSRTQSHRQIFFRVLRRTVVLSLLGSLRQSVEVNLPFFIELSSALQRIAIAYFCAFLLVRRSWRFQAATAVGILVAYALLLALVPATGVSPGSYQKGANLVNSVDIALLGRTRPDGWGTVLDTIPSISTTIIGLLLGELLLSARSGKVKIIAAVGLLGVALGWALHPLVPIIMKLWTTSYGLASTGWACLLFALFYWAIDLHGYRKWAFPFVVIGMNAITIYMAQTLVPTDKIVGIFTAGIARDLGAFGPTFQVGAVVVVEWLILYWMYRRKIFLAA